MTISSKGKLDIESGSATAIEGALDSLKKQFSRGRWLPASNRYAGGGIAKVPTDVAGMRINGTSLSQYIAAGSVRHALDGWSYLGTAIHAFSRGDSDHAVHLSYYASLRAAAALLAAQGVGVLNKDHFVVISKGTVARFGTKKEAPGTHVLAWEALNHWASLPRSADVLGAIIRPGGIPLTTWMDSGFGGMPWQRVASKWIQAWGSDLKLYAADRELRNAASYRPGGLELGAEDCRPATTFAASIWGALRPYLNSPFDEIDRHLLRRAVEASILETETRPRTRKKREKVVDRLIARMPKGVPSGFTWREFLLRDVEPLDEPILVAAGSRGGSADWGSYGPPASRATLLLRMATGAARLRLDTAGIGATDLEFWWMGLLRERGLWNGSTPPSDLLDLWLDVEDALRELSACVAGFGPTAGFQELNRDIGSQLHQLAGVERSGIWGLAL